MGIKRETDLGMDLRLALFKDGTAKILETEVVAPEQGEVRLISWEA